MSSRSYSLNRSGGEISLGHAAPVSVTPVGSSQFAILSSVTADGQPGLRVQFLNAVGQARGGAVNFAAGPAGANIVDAEVTALAGGGVVVTWLSAYSHGPQAHYAVLSSGGRVLANAVVSGAATAIDAIALPDGGFDLALAQSDPFGLHASLSLETLNAAGRLVSGPTVVDSGDNTSGTAGYGDLSGLFTGSGVELFWDNPSGVHTAVVGADGGVARADVSAGPADGLQSAMLDDGQVAMAWATDRGAGSRVLTQTLDPAAVAHGGSLGHAAVVAASSASADLAHPEIAAIDGGRYAVSWRPSAGGEASARVYSADGAAGPVKAGAGDLAGSGPGASVYTVSHHDGAYWLDRYVDPPAASSAHAAAASAAPVTPATAGGASAAHAWAGALHADLAAALHAHQGLWFA